MRSWRNTNNGDLLHIVCHYREYLQLQSGLGRKAFNTRLKVLETYGLVDIKKSLNFLLSGAFSSCFTSTKDNVSISSKGSLRFLTFSKGFSSSIHSSYKYRLNARKVFSLVLTVDSDKPTVICFFFLNDAPRISLFHLNT